ncbi:hypothetical protein [Niallia endozanthoxylica]|uniref:Uncharacterized protein n=1 Tax=Niallia endozanthoxylica TaxID=2036016 RepID=A0A5J5H4P2_9BACI|nr:hypothetical protein [Niallia endozanthoxylica]KAA9014918.1 hypothetical protein F4V44_23265 [Niallia endozanthoxylica]
MMDPKTKNILNNGMIGVAFVLLTLSLIVGRSMESEQKEKEVIKQQREGEDFSFISPSAEDNRVKENEIDSSSDLQKMESNKDLVEVIEDGNQGEIADIKELKDFFSEGDINSSKEIARKFSKKYYPFNGEDPLSHVENAKQYMTSDLYNQLSKEVPRPTLSIFNKTVKTIELYEPYDVSNKEIVWMSRINGTVHNGEGNITKEEVLEYRLNLIKEAEGFKVNNVKITLIN